MTYGIEQLVSDVMERLGEISRPHTPSGGQVPEDVGVPWPEEAVALKARGLLAAEGSRLLREASVDDLGCGGMDLSGVEAVKVSMPCGLYAAEVRMPEGYLRFAGARMSEWSRGATEVLERGSSGWSRQWSSEPGIAGCPVRPRAYLDSDSGGLLLRLVGSVSADDSLEWLGVWCVPELDAEGRFGFPAGLYFRLVEAIAAGIG